MKKFALVLTLFVGAATSSYAQDATPGFAKPRNEAEKPAIAKAQAETDEMVKMLKLDNKQALTLLEINVGAERKTASVQNSNAADKSAQLAQIENWRWEMYTHYITPKKLDMYKNAKKNTNK